MGDAPRRSSRRSNPKRVSEYDTGDIVEISRQDVAVPGRLVQLLTEGPSANPLWLVAFDGEPWKDEEIYETHFGSLIGKDGKLLTKGGGIRAPPTRSATRKKNGRSSSSSEADDDQLQPPNKKAKSVTFSAENTPVPSETDSPSMSAKERAKASAREERSKRRQAKIHEDAVTIGVFPPKGKKLPGKKNRKLGDDEEVVRVQMLTGTLYLYRGAYRRAEFVRKF
eukprot:CAMPEP_0194028570 /NCGR_PEP_ID=MMETSP0009_2-20130614/2501_1 /TAXON_ID=210454 /ORGANISM="Grammatophora oceanica, Strain CCMP 410" /LENGTH=223 /DNA_ID=CAMNT_0038667997 /DNA_START=71 /DNA_END=742 /DNA_ORIENTATION=+